MTTHQPKQRAVRYWRHINNHLDLRVEKGVRDGQA
jgi:hypothetical protein